MLVHTRAHYLCHGDEKTLVLDRFYEPRNRSVLGVLKIVGFFFLAYKANHPS